MRGGAKSKLANSGMAALMSEQGQLLDQLKYEMEGREHEDRPRDEYLMQVVRGLENKMEDIKWPAKINQRIEELDTMIGNISPEDAYRTPAHNQAARQSGQRPSGSKPAVQGMLF